MGLAVVASVITVVLLLPDDATDGPTAATTPPSSGSTDGPTQAPTQAPTEDPAAVFRDWLAPDETLRIGRERYVSPCSALPIDDVREIYGPPAAGGTTFEQILDFSVRDRGSLPTSVDTSCAYGGVVRLDADQYASRGDLRGFGLGSRLESLGDEELGRTVRRYERAVQGSDDPELEAFVADVADTSRRYLRYLDRFRDRELAGLSFEDAVQPTTQSQFAFLFFVDNVAYTLVHEQVGEESPLRSLSDSFIVSELSRAMRAIEVVRERVSDPDLSQSPAPTIPASDDTYDGTRLLEPCVVLSREVFARITGRPDTRPVERRSLPIQDPRLPPSWSSPTVSASNDCRRAGEREGAAGTTTTVFLGIEIIYEPSPRQALKSLRRGGYLPLEPGDRELRTDADLALETTGGGFGITLHTFLVGPYRIGLSYSTLTESGGFLGDLESADATQEQFVAAINAVTRSLQRHLKEAERTDGR